VKTGEVLDPEAYLRALPELKNELPRGAYRFAADPGHYDFHSTNCVHDLEFGRVKLSDEPSGVVEVELVRNQWKHNGNLVLRYWGFCSSSLDASSPVAGHRALGDLMLDELLPHEGGVRHEFAFEGSTVVVEADDLWHLWLKRPTQQTVYVFTPEGGHFPAGIWTTADEAGTWIAGHDAKGILSTYELDSSAYDAAVGRGLFKPKRAEEESNEFIANFTSAIGHGHHVEDIDQ
jgi:hypothetical protein